MRIHSGRQSERLFLEVNRARNRVNGHSRGRALSVVCTNGYRRLALGYARSPALAVHGQHVRIAAGEAAIAAIV